MPAPPQLIAPDGSLTTTARMLLHVVSGVPMPLLEHVRIRSSRQNWLRAPWYGYHRGGAITIGRTIWFTRKWFAEDGWGDGSIASMWRWLQHLAHEVGHLPQAERYGRGLWGRSRYVAAFIWQYGTRWLLMRRPIHDGAPLEIEADRGRWVLLQALGPAPLEHALLRALFDADLVAVEAWCLANTGLLRDLRRAYDQRW